jgi:hypothetical protein
MNQALYAHMNNKRKRKKKSYFNKKKKEKEYYPRKRKSRQNLKEHILCFIIQNVTKIFWL